MVEPAAGGRPIAVAKLWAPCTVPKIFMMVDGLDDSKYSTTVPGNFFSTTIRGHEEDHGSPVFVGYVSGNFGDVCPQMLKIVCCIHSTFVTHSKSVYPQTVDDDNLKIARVRVVLTHSAQNFV